MNGIEKSDFDLKLENDNRKFLEAVSKTFKEAEDYLKLPSGTLVDIHQDIDFVAIMKMSSTIEPLINDALGAEIRRFRKLKVEDEGENALADFVLGTRERTKKVELAYKMRLIGLEHQKFILAIYAIRDKYAHNVKNLQLSIVQVTDSLVSVKGKIWSDLAGLEGTNKHKGILLAILSNSPIYYRFAGFLSDALHVVKPPRLGLYAQSLNDKKRITPKTGGLQRLGMVKK